MEGVRVILLLACLTTVAIAVPQILGPPSRTVTLDEGPGSVGSPVVQLLGSDPAGGGFDFVIVNAVPNEGWWGVTTSGSVGLVTVLTAPDREHATVVSNFDVASFDVVIRDSSMSASDTVSVYVTLVDINDHEPVCALVVSTPIQLPEYLPVDIFVEAVHFSDEDVGSNAAFTYSITSPMDGVFTIDSITGVVTLGRQLDYEDAPSYNIMVEAVDGGSPALSGTCTIPVAVVDALDQAPQFTQNAYNFDLPENDYSAASVRIGFIEAVDPDPTLDPGSAVTYSKRSRGAADPTDSLFRVDNEVVGTVNLGAVYATGLLDRERLSEYYIYVEAVKVIGSGVISRVGVATVIISMEDEDDNDPTFDSSHYSALISELAVSGATAINTISAFDLDEGSNAVFTFDFQITPPMVPFSINPFSGDISVDTSSLTLDYDVGDQGYNFSIIAKEPVTLSSPRTGTATVFIGLINANDNSPVFALDQYILAAVEEMAPGTLSTTTPSLSISMIQATDGDPASDVFGQLRYSLIGIGVPDAFAVDSVTGEISTQRLLDLEGGDLPVYHLTLVAEDGAGNLALPNKAFTLIIVNVNDVNDEAPLFNPDVYAITIPETRPGDSGIPNVITFQATDPDQTTDIVYQLRNETDSTSVAPFFTIDAATGVISSGVIDYHSDFMSARLEVLAVDNGAVSPANTGTATLDVTIQEFNLADPVFLNTPYMAAVPESLAVGSPVPSLTVLASDPEGHPINYYIDSSVGTGAFFSVNESSGVVALAHAVDYEVSSERSFTFTVCLSLYSVPLAPPLPRPCPAPAPLLLHAPVPPPPLQVLAVDQPEAAGIPRTGSAVVTVSVTDVNDNSPIIASPSSPHTVTLLEGTNPTYRLVVMASDIDGSSDGTALTYMLTHDTTVTYFTFDSVTTEVRQSAALDAETDSSVTLTLTVCDMGTSLPRCSDLTIFVTVADVNDHAPVFSSPMYSNSVAECIDGGTSVGMVTATDSMDSPGDFTEVNYFISGGANASHFSVEASTGIIRLSQQGLDYEVGSLYTATIGARDYPDGPAAEQLTATLPATFRLTVTDCNDNPPVFQPSDRYVFAINESSAAVTMDTDIGTVVTTDADGPTNSVVQYQLRDGLSSTNDWFDIHPSSGKVFIRSGFEVDREASSGVQINAAGEGVIAFDVVAVNNGDMGNFASTASVTVRIADINDNSPVFDSGLLTAVAVLENAAVGTLLTILSASDADSEPDSVAIQYSITAGNSGGLFSLDGQTGVLTVNAILDEETMSSHTLTISAANHLASGVAADTVMVMVTVLEGNDHSPVFDQARYAASVAEHDELTGMGVMVGYSLSTVHATDLDMGGGATDSTGSIQYFITGGNEDAIFAVDPVTGAVTVQRPELLDYELRQQYDLVVTATDLVLPATRRRQNTTHFVVSVTDVNDNAPRLSAASYSGSVTEEQPAGTTVLVTPSIAATDRDQDGAEMLTIEFSSGTPSIAFNISSNGSIVVTTTSIDRETTQSFTITVRVRDSSSHEDLATLVVTVGDINDSPPVIQQSSSQLDITVPENFPLACSVATDCFVQNVSAVDQDEGPNAHFTFTITGHEGVFQINQFTGEISLAQSLDREQTPFYTVTVTATDTARNAQSVSFTITVGNLNDNSPVFTAPAYSGSVEEGVPVGTTLNLQVTAIDLDENSTVYYAKLPGPAVPFDVDDTTGRVFTTGVLDRESVGFFSFMVEADDGFLGTSSPQALVEVSINDVNDESPLFDYPVYENDVQEGSTAGSIILQVHATDRDTGPNALLEYSIIGVVADRGSAANYFEINIETGHIGLLRSVTVSASEPTNVNLTVQARDKTNPFNSNTALVVFSIIDANSNAPAFERVFYEFSVFENLPNSVVGTVVANETSTDMGVNAEITYFLPDINALFSIDQHGVIRTGAAAVDRENRDTHTFRIAARDNAISPRTGFATVTVSVMDVNDNPPVFNPSVYPIGISESTLAGSAVITVMASDQDIGLNGNITFDITSGDTTVFEVELTGLIRTKLPLDREQTPVYALTVTARDMGDLSGGSRLLATANVTVFLNDDNDNSPRFVSGVDDISVYENITDGTLLATLNATDVDYQINAIVVYTFENGSDVSGPFSLDLNTGELRTRAMIDREQTDSYMLTVVATDRRGAGRATPSTILVTLLDVNDNDPYLLRSSWNFAISEDQEAFLPFDVVQGADDDVGSNAALFYYIVDSDGAPSECYTGFCIGLSTGELFTDGTGEADREKQDTYILQVAVSNIANFSLNGTAAGPNLDATSALGTVQVTVTDVNDNHPIFVESSLLAAVAEEAEFGATVTVIQATDADIGDHALVYYNIITGQVPYLIDRDTGVVTTAGVFKGLSGTVHVVEVRAFDNLGNSPSLSTTSMMQVQIFKTTEQVILTLGTQLEVVEDKIDSITLALELVGSARLIITAVRVQRTDDGSVDVTGTDIIFFALDPNTGAVIEPDVFIGRFDESFASVADLFNQCNFESVRSHPPLPSTSYPTWLWAIVGVLAAVILLGCCCFFCLLVVERRRTKRLKKQNQLSSYQSQVDQFNAISNPLWVSPYDNNWEEESTEPSGTQVERDNPLYESQELTIEMFQDDEDDAESVGSREYLLKAPPLSGGRGLRGSAFSGADDDELLAEAIGEKKHSRMDSETSLI